MRFTTGLVGLSFSLLTAAACTGTIGDDTGGDDPDDPMTPTRTDIRVSIKDANAPQAGVRVVFQNSDDSVVLDTLTDATGLATAEMAFGNVTVIRTYPPVIPTPPEGQRAPEVFTYIGAKNGDLLEIGNSGPATPPTPGAIIVKVPTEAQGTVNVKTPCGSGAGQAPNVAITVNNCPAMMPLYVTDGADTSFFMQAPYAENIDVSTGILQSRLATTISSTNVPLESTVNVDQRLVAGTFTVYSTGNRRVDIDPAQVNVPDISGVDQLLVTTVQTANKGTQIITERTPYANNTVTVNAGAALIPYVSNVQYSATGVSWLEAGGTGVDAVYLALHVTRGGNGGTVPTMDAEYTRLIIAPHNASSQLRLPTVPDAKYIPGATDQIAGSHGLIRAAGGYDAVRAQAFATENIVDMTPAGGSITLSYTGPRPGR